MKKLLAFLLLGLFTVVICASPHYSFAKANDVSVHKLVIKTIDSSIEFVATNELNVPCNRYLIVAYANRNEVCKGFIAGYTKPTIRPPNNRCIYTSN